MSTIEVTNINDISGNASLVTDNGGLKTDKLTGKTTAGSISVVGEGNSTTTNLQQGLAKSWSAVNGSGTIAILDSFNTASISDIGTGVHEVTYISVMSNASYSATVSHQESQLNNSYGSHATGSVRSFSRKDDGTYSDIAHKSLSVHGDLA